MTQVYDLWIANGETVPKCSHGFRMVAANLDRNTSVPLLMNKCGVGITKC